MFDYSTITKLDLENDIKNTLNIGLEQIQKIKNEDTPSLGLFDLFERTISDLSGRVAFMADVSKVEEIRDYGNEAESIIENFLLIFWLHFLSINLFIGSWMSRDAQKYMVPKILTMVSLILIYFSGPVGLVFYWIIRIFFARKISFYE